MRERTGGEGRGLQEGARLVTVGSGRGPGRGVWRGRRAPEGEEAWLGIQLRPHAGSQRKPLCLVPAVFVWRYSIDGDGEIIDQKV